VNIMMKTEAQLTTEVAKLDEHIEELVALAKTDEVVESPPVPPQNAEEAQHDIDKLTDEIKEAKTAEKELTSEETHVDSMITEIEQKEQKDLQALSAISNPTPQQIQELTAELQKDMKLEQDLDAHREKLEENIVQVENAVASEDAELATLDILAAKEGENVEAEKEMEVMKEELETLERHDQEITNEEHHLEAEIAHNPEYQGTPAPAAAPAAEAHHNEHNGEHGGEQHNAEHNGEHGGEHNGQQQHNGGGEQQHNGEHGGEHGGEHEHNGEHHDRQGPPSGGVDPDDPIANGAPTAHSF